MFLLRMAYGMAMNRAAEHRWRRLGVAVGAFLATCTLLASSSILLLVDREGERDVARSAMLSRHSSPSDLFVLVRPDRWQDREILVVWLQPESEDGRTVLPPGMAALPGPGEAVISPALHRLVQSSPGLASRYRVSGQLTEGGLRSGGELIAYVRAPEGRSLGETAQALRIEGGRYAGQGPLVRVGSFGSADGSEGFIRFGEPPAVGYGTLAVGVGAVLVLPGLVLLAVGLGAASDLRRRRLGILRALGARERTIEVFSILEALVLAAPGVLLAALTGLVALRYVSRVPVVGYEVVRGDLALPVWLVILVVAAVALAVAAFTRAATKVARRRPVRSRPVEGRPTLSMLRLVPLVMAVLAMAMGRANGGYGAADYYLTGIALAAVGVPLAVPIVLRGLGAAMARLGSVVANVAGRTMQWDPTLSARPFIGTAALIFILLAGVGYLTLGKHGLDEGPETRARNALTLEWQDPTRDDLAVLQRALPRVSVALFSDGGNEHAHADGTAHQHGGELGVVQVGATCAQLVGEAACDPARPDVVPDARRSQVLEWFRPVAHGPLDRVELVDPAELAGAASAVVIGERPLTELDESVRTAVGSSLPALYVRSALDGQVRESPLMSWLRAGLATATVVLFIASFIALVDRLLAARRHDRLLVNIGVPARRLMSMSALTFAAPYTVVITLGSLVGVAACAVLLAPDPLPWPAVGRVLTVTTVVGVLGTVAVAVLGSRAALREPE